MLNSLMYGEKMVASALGGTWNLKWTIKKSIHFIIF